MNKLCIYYRAIIQNFNINDILLLYNKNLLLKTVLPTHAYVNYTNTQAPRNKFGTAPHTKIANCKTGENVEILEEIHFQMLNEINHTEDAPLT